MAKKQSLGKGLDVIFDDNTVESGTSVAYLSLGSVVPKKNQPRKNFDMEALSDLASSIGTHGVLQPILVRDLKNGTYEIMAGERRWRASKLAGLSEIPCIIMDADEILSAQVALIENVQREDLNPYEEAKAYKALVDDFGLSQEEVSRMVGKSRPAIANSLRLLDLPDEIAEMLEKGDLSAGHCRTLLGLRDRKDMEPLAIRIVKRNLSVREAESAVKKLNRKGDLFEDGEVNDLTINYYDEIARKAMTFSGRKIRITNTSGRRFVQVDYTDNEDLENLLSAICGKSVIETE